jgi:hypothetical protein
MSEKQFQVCKVCYDILSQQQQLFAFCNKLQKELDDSEQNISGCLSVVPGFLFTVVG